MKIYYIVFTILLFHLSHAHKNKLIQKVYGNIQLFTYASDYVEEMNKTLIIGQYAELLAAKYTYRDKIYLYFVEEQNDDPSIKVWLPSVNDNSDNLDGVNLIFKMKEYSISGCLKVIENAILNKNKLKSFIKKQQAIYDSQPSNKLLELLQIRIDRPSEIKELEKPLYSYFVQNNKYHIIIKEEGKESEISIVDNLLDFQVLSRDIVIVFTDLDDFKIFQTKNSERTVHINTIPSFYWPYFIHLSGDNKIIIEFSPLSNQKDRVMIYYLDTNVFIQDLDKALKMQ